MAAARFRCGCMLPFSSHSLSRTIPFVCLPLMFLSACSPTVQSVRIAAQDFRFVPAMITVDAARPIRLLIVNEGREPHEFTSDLLVNPRVRILVVPAEAGTQPLPPGVGLRLLPGKSLELIVEAPPGTYLFRCLIKGHRGMEGTIVVSA